MKLWIILLVIGCSLMGGLAQVFLKKGMDGFIFSLLDLIKNYYLIAGVVLYGLAFVLYTFALKYENVSMIYGLIALSYVWVMILAGLVLKEPVTIKQVIGAFVVVSGVYLIAGR